MSMRRLSLAAVLLLILAVPALAQPQATIVLTNGQQYSGTLIAQNNSTSNISLDVNGRRMSWPQRSVALIAFAPGEPDQAEIQQVSNAAGSQSLLRGVLTSSNVAAVMQDGQVVSGRFAGFSSDGNQLTLVSSSNQRNNYMTSDIARLYLNPSAAQQLYASNRLGQQGTLGTGGQAQPVIGTSGQAQSISVPANQAWTGTRITVHQGDQLTFRASGQIHWGPQSNEVVGPQGGKTISPNYPLQTAGVGALIGRVGNGQPFLIPSYGATITMPADGELFLGINDDVFTDNSGNFQVQVARIGGM